MMPPGAGGAAPPLVPPTASSCAKNLPGPRALRRLSADQYQATLRDLFKDPAVPSASVLNDPEVLGFKADADRLVIQELVGQQLADQAEAVARWAVATKLPSLSPCASMDPACRQQFIRSLGGRAFRQPLGDDQLKAYEALFAAEATFNDGAEVVIAAMLQSPYFLYRRELGAPDPAVPGTVLLTQHEIASGLSYLLIGSMPDDELLAAAAAGKLSTPAELDVQTERLLKDPRSGDAIMAFAQGWLGLDRLFTRVKDDAVFKLTDVMRNDMLRETRGLVLDAFQRNAPLSDLLTAKFTFVNRPLAEYYGIDAPGADAQRFVKVMLPPGKRDPGILAHASLLTGHAAAKTSSPVFRGHMVQSRLLCQEVPDPPGDIDTMLKEPKSNQSTRERYAEHSTNPKCAACHHLLDPVGFGFEHYDGFGRRREMDAGKPVDATGSLTSSSDMTKEVAFDGLSELGAIVAGNPRTSACMVRYWAYFAFGHASWTDDACTYEAIQKQAAQGGSGLKSVLLAITHAPHFTRRVLDP